MCDQPIMVESSIFALHRVCREMPQRIIARMARRDVHTGLRRCQLVAQPRSPHCLGEVRLSTYSIHRRKRSVSKTAIAFVLQHPVQRMVRTVEVETVRKCLYCKTFHEDSDRRCPDCGTMTLPAKQNSEITKIIVDRNQSNVIITDNERALGRSGSERVS